MNQRSTIKRDFFSVQQSRHPRGYYLFNLKNRDSLTPWIEIGTNVDSGSKSANDDVPRWCWIDGSINIDKLLAWIID
jgi:hypothetical protein